MERLDKFVSNSAFVTRSEAKKLIQKGQVSVNDKIIRDCCQKVDPEGDTIEISGRKIQKREYICLALNKPEGVITSTQKGPTPTVLDILPPSFKKYKDLAPAGRLDKDTTGLVIITDDGRLNHNLTSPAHHTSKQYLVTLSRPFEDGYIKLFESGITLADGTKCRPAKICQSGEYECKVILTEGKYHQVKRMFAALGNHVEILKRAAIGNYLMPPDLGLGETVVLLHKDILKLTEKSETFF